MPCVGVCILFNLAPVDFEAYLLSKKIDAAAFLRQEPQMWNTWKREFDQIHPKSFTAQKLYLINPVRRKYPLTIEEEKAMVPSEPKPVGVIPASDQPKPSTSKPKPVIPRPVFKPKPKTDD